ARTSGAAAPARRPPPAFDGQRAARLTGLAQHRRPRRVGRLGRVLRPCAAADEGWTAARVPGADDPSVAVRRCAHDRASRDGPLLDPGARGLALRLGWV